MKVKLLNITPDAEDHIVEIARVSSKRKNKRQNATKLIRYLIKHKHWSPFEHAHLTFEIETSKAIGIQLIRHRSFSFQEFSQRYQDVKELGDIFEPVALRRQCDNNRQSSTESFNPDISMEFSQPAQMQVHALMAKAASLYNKLLDAGVARETARMVLPLATKTKIHMTGSVRSWMHFLELRDDEHAQLEIQEIAREIRKQMTEHLPNVMAA